MDQDCKIESLPSEEVIQIFRGKFIPEIDKLFPYFRLEINKPSGTTASLRVGESKSTYSVYVTSLMILNKTCPKNYAKRLRNHFEKYYRKL